MVAITTQAVLGSRRSYRLATRISVALFLASGLVGLAGSRASALAPRGGPGGGGSSWSIEPRSTPRSYSDSMRIMLFGRSHRHDGNSLFWIERLERRNTCVNLLFHWLTQGWVHHAEQ
jgi:hypothetical protein